MLMASYQTINYIIDVDKLLLMWSNLTIYSNLQKIDVSLIQIICI